ncbi:tRNA(Glu)-specific nuclease WapA precursor [Rubripirellula tenax]|uniref:tRNA(Glu)-specific nuclease WapA n=1 Tax=Rubripirellula tenax TaxID=2528015 RepID=A0A5C6EKV3_9BACT|nr:FG-GAP-like repeat-containing protein [Rubripirellula tenax]TWU48737.1 tRNA(Glu)-specific nuclease WapA precursor [Rubripirellula tenax]
MAHKRPGSKKKTRRPRLESLEVRRLLASDWRNPADNLDVNADLRISASDALVVINELGRRSSQSNATDRFDLLEPRPSNRGFVDVNGSRTVSALDALTVINALGRGISGQRVLAESNAFASEQRTLVAVGQDAGTRTYRMEVDANFGSSPQVGIDGDLFAVYLLDPEDTSRSLVGDGTRTPLFSLTATEARNTTGISRWDGRILELDFSSVTGAEDGLLVLQSLNRNPLSDSTFKLDLLSNSVDPDGTPVGQVAINSESVAPGAIIDTATFTSSTSTSVVERATAFDSATRLLTTEIAIQNIASSVSRSSVISFPGLPAGVTVENASGTGADGSPYINLRGAIGSGGLPAGVRSGFVPVHFHVTGDQPLNLTPQVLVGLPNLAPVLESLTTITVTPGSRAELQLLATDADGDELTYSITSQTPLPNATQFAGGRFTFAPTPGQVGTYTVEAIVSDSLLSDRQTFTLIVVTDPVVTTRIAGRILDVDGSPISGIQVELGGTEVLTDSVGGFLLDVGAGLPVTDTLRIRGELLTIPGATYPFIAEKLPLMLGGAVQQGQNNTIVRPIYLPKLDVANGKTISATEDTLVTTAAIPGASVLVQAGTLFSQSGTPFTGTLSITEVPRELTPAALPAGFVPDLVVTIQPGDMVFTQPTPLTLPNRSGLPAGVELDLWSINPVTGEFDNVGRGRVSTDGSVVETISGGIRNSSWHLFVLNVLNIDFNRQNLFNQDYSCDPCQELLAGTSMVEAHSGAVIENHNLVTYRSQGVSRGVQLVYNSFRADPRPIVHDAFALNVDTNQFAGSIADVRVVSYLTVTGNGLRVEGDDHFWRTGLGGQTQDIAIQVDLSNQPTGIYDYTMRTGFVVAPDGDITQSSGIRGETTGQLLHVNSIASPFGSGWELAGLQYLVESQDGSVILVDGNGTELLFKLATGGLSYDSPAGHFSTLSKLLDGTFRHTTTDQSVATFDSDNRLISSVDRNGNATLYGYTNGRLATITDPVGLITTLNYTDGKVTSIIDPVGRTTLLQYDDRGNLIRVTDPDNTTRTWSYDGRSHIVAEVDKRGFREEMQYDFAGRAQRATRKDGSILQYKPVQVQGLSPAEKTSSAASAPFSLRRDTVVSTFVDGNGNVTTIELNTAGQSVSGRDGVGSLGATVYNNDLLPVSTTDARGFRTTYSYDANGNVIGILDSVSAVGGAGGVQFPAPALLADTQVGSFFAGDLNGDGAIDFLVDDQVILNNGSGGILPPEYLNGGFGYPSSIYRLKDMNGDGLTDIISSVGVEYTAGLNIWLQNTDGTFGTALAYHTDVLPGDYTEDYYEPDDPENPFPDVRSQVRQPGMVVVDFNNDSRPDVLLTQPEDEINQPFASFIYYENDGNGGLNSPVLIHPDDSVQANRPGYVWAVEAADLNGDGNQDIVVSNTRNVFVGLDVKITVMLGDGTGGFGSPANYSLGFESNGASPLFEAAFLKLVDLNNDGQLDAFVASQHEGLASVVFGDGLGGFGVPTIVTELIPEGNEFPYWTAIEAADLNDDGFNDLALTSKAGAIIRVLLNNGDGTFDTAQDYFFDNVFQGFAASDSIVISLLATDFDKDGFVDLLTPSNIGNDVSYLRGRGDGTFAAWDEIDLPFAIPYTTAGNAIAPEQIESADFNRDGIADIITRHYEAGLEVRFGLGNRQYAEPLVLDSGASALGRRQMMIVDFDGDNLDDVVWEILDNTDTQNFKTVQYVYINNGDGTFDEPVVVDFGIAGSLNGGLTTAGDFNNDGVLDFVLRRENYGNNGYVNSTIFMALDDGVGGYTVSSFVADGRPQQIETGDINHDGNLDLVISTRDTGTILVYIGDGVGAFTAAAPITAGGVRDYEIVDLNADGFNDIAVVAFDQSRLVLDGGYLLNDGTGQFDAVNFVGAISQRSFTVASLEFVEIADVDGDGVLDIVLASAAQYHVAAGIAGGGFGSSTAYRGGGFDATVVDLDNDGVNDILGARTQVRRINRDDHYRNAITMHYGERAFGPTPRLYTYDPVFNQLTSITDELGRQTFFEIDPTNGNTLSITEVIGLPDATSSETNDLVTRYTYLGNGLVDTVTDPLDRVTDFDYDALGRGTQVTLAAGTADEGIITFTLDAAGNVTEIVDPNLNRSTFTFDPLNRQLSFTDPLLARATFVYDAAGNLIESVDRGGSEMTYVYDGLSRMVGATDEQSNTTRYRYDDSDNLSSVTDPLGQATRFLYDARERLIAKVDPDSGVTRFVHDLDNNVTRLIDPLGNLTRFTYDARDRVISEFDPLGNEIRYEFDLVDNLIEKTDRNGRVTQYQYDDVDRLARETWFDNNSSVANTIDYVFDKATNLLSITDDFSALTWTYDARDRFISESNAGTPGAPAVLLQYTYDGVGNILSVTDAINGTAGAATSYLYDALNRVQSMTQTGNGGSSVADKRVDIAYNAIGQFASINRFSDPAGTQLVVGTNFTYDSLNRLERIAHDSSRGTVAFYDYLYDADSRITQINDVDGITDYSYDDRDQLTGADHADGANPDENYTYDANGNRIESHLQTVGYVTGPANRLLSDGTYGYEYDAEGNRVLQTLIANGDYREFQYDHRNRLVAVVDYAFDATLQQRVDFTYDSLDRRISKDANGTATYFVYDRIDVLLDFIDVDGVGGDAPTLDQRYLHGPAIDQVFAQETGNSEVNWLLADHLGTIRDVADTNGEIVNHIRYDSFGNVASQSDETKSTRYGFTGREIDDDIDLYYYRNRFYDAQAGVFISEDPIRFSSGDSNLSRYVANRVLTAIDPFGTETTMPSTGVLNDAANAASSILNGVGGIAGEIQDIRGDDCVIISNGKKRKAKKGDLLRHGDQVYTGADTVAAIELSVGGRIGIKRSSGIDMGWGREVYAIVDGRLQEIQLEKGGMWAKFAKQDKGNKLTIQTSGGVLGIKG